MAELFYDFSLDPGLGVTFFFTITLMYTLIGIFISQLTPARPEVQALSGTFWFISVWILAIMAMAVPPSAVIEKDYEDKIKDLKKKERYK